MRKVDGRKRKERKEKIMSFLVATNVVASRPPNADQLERRTLVPIPCVKSNAPVAKIVPFS